MNEFTLEFSENTIEKNDVINIELIFPKAKGSSDIATKINSEIESTIIKNIAFFEEDTNTLNLENVIFEIEKRYTSFKEDFEDSAIKWDVNISGEVVYKSPEIITVGLDSYTFTGGAHGNSVITLLNFNSSTGQLLTIEDLFTDKTKLTAIVKSKLDKEINLNSSNDSYFFSDGFKLPENIGFSDDGVIFLYNTYEIASYAQGVTEFTIPYEDIQDMLKVN